MWIVWICSAVVLAVAASEAWNWMTDDVYRHAIAEGCRGAPYVAMTVLMAVVAFVQWRRNKPAVSET